MYFITLSKFSGGDIVVDITTIKLVESIPIGDGEHRINVVLQLCANSTTSVYVTNSVQDIMDEIIRYNRIKNNPLGVTK